MIKLQLLLILSTVFFPLSRFALAAKETVPHQPSQLISLNVVSDEIILGLAKYCSDLKAKVQLSPLAHDSRYSAIANTLGVEPWRQVQDLETIVKAKPSQAIVSSYNKVEWLQGLKKIGVGLTYLKDSTSLETVRQNIFKVGEAVTCQEGATALVKEYDAALAKTAHSCRKSKVMLLPTNGFIYGEATLSDAILQHLGLENMARLLDVKGVNRVQTEALSALSPDCFITSGNETDRGVIWEMIERQKIWQKTPAFKNRCLVLVSEALLSSGSQHVLALMASLREQLSACSPANAAKKH